MNRIRLVLGLLATLALIGCTNENASRRTLQAHGFTEIEFTGYSFFACSDDDTFHTGFVATNQQGQRVSGTVCCGLVTKACTVRF